MIPTPFSPSLSPRAIRAACRRLVGRIASDTSGIAAVEFAMILPAMLTIYLGVVEVGMGVMADRKVTQLNRALADMAAQSSAIAAPAEFDAIFNAATSVMTPFSVANVRMVISSIVIDASGVAKVCWSEHRNAAALTRGATVALPTDLRVPNSSVIMAQSSYDLKPDIGYVLTGTIRIGDTPIYMRPRAGRTSSSAPIEQVERTGTSPSTPLC